MIGISKHEFSAICREIEDPLIESEMLTIKECQHAAEVDFHTEGHNDNPFCPFTQTFEYNIYRNMAKYLQDPDYFL